MDEKIKSVAPKPEAPRGMYNGKLDEKGRLKMPAQFQAYLELFVEGKFYVTSTDRATAQIYPMSAWRENETRLTNGTIPPKVANQILFTSNDLGQDQTMDTQGRITFNSELRDSLKMDGQALRLYSEFDHIQILTDAVYRKKKQESIEEAATAREEAEGYGLR